MGSEVDRGKDVLVDSIKELPEGAGVGGGPVVCVGCRIE